MSAKVEAAIDVRPKAPPYVRATSRGSPWVSVLEVTHVLPDVCARHGNPAVDYVHQKTSGIGTVGKPKERNPGESWLDRAKQGTTVEFDLHARWPQCRTCLRQRKVGLFLACGAALPLVVLFLVLVFSLSTDPLQSLEWVTPVFYVMAVCGAGVFAGIVMRWLWGRPAWVTINDESMVAIEAHHRFADGLPAVSPRPLDHFGPTSYMPRWMAELGPQPPGTPQHPDGPPESQQPAGLIPSGQMPGSAAVYSQSPGTAPYAQTPGNPAYSQQSEPSAYRQPPGPAPHQQHPHTSGGPDRPSEAPPL